MKNKENRGFNFALPFDPFRLLLALLEKSGLIIIAAIVCAVLGVAYAVVKLGDTYTASVTLASEGWQTKSPDEGSSYVAMPITDEAVVIAANAEDVFDIAAKKIDASMPGGAVRSRVSLEQLPGEGLFKVHATTGESAELTHKVVTAYAEAILDYTALIRQDEARKEYKQLEKQLTEKQAAAKETRDEIEKFARKEGIMDPLGTGGGAGAELAVLKKQLSDAKLKYKSNNDLILSYIRQEVVAPLKQELATLLEGRSETHSMVRGKKQEIARIEGKLDAAMSEDSVNIDEFESMLSAPKLLAVQRLKEERKVLENTIQNYTERLSDTESDLGGLQGSSLAMAEMRQVLNQRIVAAAVINGRMGDAEFFANNAPPSISIFHAPSLDEVHHKPLKTKAITLAILGLMGGAGAIAGLALVLELIGRKVRTPMQAAIAAGAYPKLVYPPSRKTSNDIALRNFWIRGVARFLPTERRVIVPVIGDIPNEEGFWTGLFDSIKDEKQRVVFVDFSADKLSLGLPAYNSAEVVAASTIDPDQFVAADLIKMVENFPEGHVLMVRWDMSPTSMLVDLAPHMDRQYILTSQETSLSYVEEESRNYRDVFGDADGLVLVNSKRPKRSQMIVNRLQDWYLESYRRRDVRLTNPTQTPLAH